MARRLSKRKAPKKEFKQTDAADKIESRVFDRGTLLVLAKMTEHDYFDTLDFPLSMGKEAVVFRATRNPRKLKKGEAPYVAVKIYKIETTSFLNMYDYLVGDRRFSKVKKNRFDIIMAWAKKEYANLSLAHRAGVRCPKPIACMRNAVVMEFIGREGEMYPTLQNNGPVDAESDFAAIVKYMKLMYGAGIVHADLSPYNIIITEDGPVVIDMSQAVVLTHPKANEFLRRDIYNIVKYFRKFGVRKEEGEVYSFVTDSKRSRKTGNKTR